MSAVANARQEQIERFLSAAGFADARIEPLPGDASTRRYARVFGRGQQLMLMDQPRGAETAACPPDASPAQRQALGYNAVARLAGPDCRPFAAVAAFLRDHGLSAPEIVAHDYEHGFLLLEDLGNGRFADLIMSGTPEVPLYASAVDVLAHLHQVAAPATLQVPGAGVCHLLTYDTLAMEAEVQLLIDWFLPAASGSAVDDEVRRAFLDAWTRALSKLSVQKPVMVLRDYHAENLMWLDRRHSLQRAGLLDFQDALAGHAAYDLISLTEDARREVSLELNQAMTQRYIDLRKSADRHFDADELMFAAALLAAQRNTKIVGIFARLWKRDGKPRYTQFLPRMWRYLERDLSHPELSELRNWFTHYVPHSYRGTLGQ